MLNGCYTYKELITKYGWSTPGEGCIKDQMRYARKRGVEIEVAFKQGPTYFRIISDSNNLTTEVWKINPLYPDLEVSN